MLLKEKKASINTEITPKQKDIKKVRQAIRVWKEEFTTARISTDMRYWEMKSSCAAL
jgi:hypothetical protein